MTHQNDYTVAQDLVEKGLEGVPELMRVLINNIMQVERAMYLQAGEYERTDDRIGHSNGYKPKTVKTRVREITFAIPQVREGGFYPSALEKSLRSERALVTTLAEMYIQGVSTRKIKAITEELCGVEVWRWWLVERPLNWTRYCSSGGKGRWEKSLISIWMPAMKRCERLGKCAMQRFWWLQASLQRGKGRY